MCHVYSIISVTDKNTYCKTINDILRQINSAYNSIMIKICEETKDDNKVVDDNKLVIDTFPLINSLNLNIDSPHTYENIRELINFYKVINKDVRNTSKYSASKYNDPFSEVKTVLLNQLGSKIGFKSLSTL